jgi:hypothetical protein
VSRYKVVQGSESGHCCFDATVIDTLFSEGSDNHLVCECFEVEQANLIAKLLNAGHELMERVVGIAT